MAHRLHLIAAQDGAEAIARFRKANPDTKLVLDKAELQGRDFSGVDLSGADLKGANLNGCIFREAVFDGADLTSATLERADLTGASLQNVQLNSSRLSGATFTDAILINTTIQDASLDKAIMIRADLTNANCFRSSLTEVDFSGAKFENTVLKGTKLNSATFSKSVMPANTFNATVLETCEMRKLTFSSLDLSELDLSNLQLSSSTFVDVSLVNTNLRRTRFDAASFSNVMFSGTLLENADFYKAVLSGLSLDHLDLTGVNFDHAVLDHSSLLGTTLDSTTKFGGVSCYCLRVDRFTAEYMRDSLNHGQMMDLRITDDLATLRSEFSGVWAATHLLGISVFVLPYLWFLFLRFVSSELLVISESALTQVETWSQNHGQVEDRSSSDNSHITITGRVNRTAQNYRNELPLSRPVEISVLNAMCRYIWNGGIRWRDGYFLNLSFFLSFLVVSGYNLLRITLLWKTKKLETEQAVTGLPVKFSLGQKWSRWRTIYRLNYAGYWLSLALIIWNTLNLLMRTVRI